VSDIGALARAIGWMPAVPFREGLRTLEQWLESRFGSNVPAEPTGLLRVQAGVRA
jgi:hypothetical protein